MNSRFFLPPIENCAERLQRDWRDRRLRLRGLTVETRTLNLSIQPFSWIVPANPLADAGAAVVVCLTPPDQIVSNAGLTRVTIFHGWRQ
jgi:hypothetical protein